VSALHEAHNCAEFSRVVVHVVHQAAHEKNAKAADAALGRRYRAAFGAEFESTAAILYLKRDVTAIVAMTAHRELPSGDVTMLDRVVARLADSKHDIGDIPLAKAGATGKCPRCSPGRADGRRCARKLRFKINH